MVTSLQTDNGEMLTEMGNHQLKMTYLNNESVMHSAALESLEGTTQKLLGDISGMSTHMLRNIEETANTLKQADPCVRIE